MTSTVNLVLDRVCRLLRSAADRTLCGPAYTQHLWRQELRCWRAASLEESIPSYLRQDVNYEQFKRQLKTPMGLT